MLSHEQIWSAVDLLAARFDMTPSALAKRAGLDPTTFNKSKRFAGDGRPRWPSTESLAKILEATGASLEEFYGMLVGEKKGSDLLPQQSSVPLIGLARAGAGGFFDSGGLPVGNDWDEVSFPGERGEAVFALEVTGDSMAPLYRDGDVIIVSPSAQTRRGDKVVVRTRSGEVMAKVLSRRSPRAIELASLNPVHADRSIPVEDVEWIARILWASQ
ncbi:LexA repressor [Hartmannibacter diazotrophicus]|uniref:LexA repressor n=1 Tax=Hartmannibacter diazotrophicus TaxID=1482074 RepID=A0A2C9DDZ7_9HYPH|nr:helix-turn-helix transcriptional regulator [Hartmannibacter diazotrophicus]SON58338.1 LexA repressor [Hartmannibacter diazotrophicus]